MNKPLKRINGDGFDALFGRFFFNTALYIIAEHVPVGGGGGGGGVRRIHHGEVENDGSPFSSSQRWIISTAARSEMGIGIIHWLEHNSASTFGCSLNDFFIAENCEPGKPPSPVESSFRLFSDQAFTKE